MTSHDPHARGRAIAWVGLALLMAALVLVLVLTNTFSLKDTLGYLDHGSQLAGLSVAARVSILVGGVLFGLAVGHWHLIGDRTSAMAYTMIVASGCIVFQVAFGLPQLLAGDAVHYQFRVIDALILVSFTCATGAGIALARRRDR